ncbi:MAG: ABC transporter ATP-binding protein [Candidatus Hodarchaeota archaeon]
MGITIKTPKLEMEIRLVSIDSLYIHEETIPDALEQLKQELGAEQVLRHPMIVDSKTLVVLDGMHRVAALRDLGCRLAPVCLVDYQNASIQLFAWYREFEGKCPLPVFANSLSEQLSLELRKTSTDDAIALVNSRSAIAALALGNQAFLLTMSKYKPIKEVYDQISRIESFAKQSGYQIHYSTKLDALKNIRNKIRTGLIVPALSKEEVIECALNQELFTQKATRHVVPARPLFVNVPLPWLKSIDINKANQKLVDYLNKKQIVEQDPGIIINGRRYEERAYIFTDP